MTNQNEPLPVEQIDRDAAAGYCRARHIITSRESEAIMRGDWDATDHVQQFTAFRLSAATRRDDAVEGPLAFTSAVAKQWWQAKMPGSKFIAARLGGDGYVKIGWKDEDESGDYSVPWITMSNDLAALRLQGGE